ncbi:MAG: acyl carrier protein [Myxococcota bacterium]|nr:acyl carrier protein [Myxococcota bacterium]
MTTANDVLPRLITLAGERFGKRSADLRPADDLFDSLGIDSVEAMSLLTALEETFGVEIPDYEVQDVRTFEELATLIARRV